MNRQLLLYLLTNEELFLDYVGKLEGLGLQRGDWNIINWVKSFRREQGKLPTWNEIQVRFDGLPAKEVLDIIFIKKEIMRYVQQEKLKSFVIGVAGEIDVGKVNYSKVFEDLKRLRDELGFDIVEGSNIKEVVGKVLSDIVSPEHNVRVTTGLKGLDRVLDGGFGRGELAIMIAPPGIGKTSFLLNTMYASLASRKHTLFISCELSEHRLMERLYRRIAKKTRKDIRLSPDKVREHLDRFFKYVKVDGFILYKRPYVWGVEDIGLYIDKLRAKGLKIDVLLVDYLDKLRVGKGDFRLALRDLAEDLRYLSIEKNVVVITATQANRLSLSAVTITEEHVSESFGKIEVSDVIMSLGRTQKDEERGMGRIVLLKNRESGGRGSIIPIEMDLDRCVIKDVE